MLTTAAIFDVCVGCSLTEYECNNLFPLLASFHWHTRNLGLKTLAHFLLLLLFALYFFSLTVGTYPDSMADQETRHVSPLLLSLWLADTDSL